MAKRLDDFPEELRTRTGGSYPWDEWLDGSVWQLVQGEDYIAKTKSFASNAMAQARKRGGRLRTATMKDEAGMVIQYLPPALGHRAPAKNPPAPLVRVWAKANGWPDLPDKGTLPAEVVSAYRAANS